MMYSNNCYTVRVEWYHQQLAEQARDRDLLKLYELQNNILKQRIESADVLFKLQERRTALVEQLMASYQLLDEYDKLLSINEN